MDCDQVEESFRPGGVHVAQIARVPAAESADDHDIFGISRLQLLIGDFEQRDVLRGIRVRLPEASVLLVPDFPDFEPAFVVFSAGADEFPPLLRMLVKRHGVGTALFDLPVIAFENRQKVHSVFVEPGKQFIIPAEIVFAFLAGDAREFHVVAQRSHPGFAHHAELSVDVLPLHFGVRMGGDSPGGVAGAEGGKCKGGGQDGGRQFDPVHAMVPGVTVNGHTIPGPAEAGPAEDGWNGETRRITSCAARAAS